MVLYAAPPLEYHCVSRQADTVTLADTAENFSGNVLIRIAANPRAGQNPGSAMKSIETPGPIAHMSVPSDWDFTEDEAASSVRHGYNYEFTPARRTDVTVAIYHRGSPLSHQDGQYFHNLLATNSNLKAPKVLYTEDWEKDSAYTSNTQRQKQVKEIMQRLSTAMGVNSLGNNQFTNNHKPPDTEAPVFHVERVELRTLKGRTIMDAEGYMTDPQTGGPQSFVKVTFMEQPDPRALEVHEFMLHARTKAAFVANKPMYSRILESAIWR
ncbi:MAG TPA: hypothetical protein V6D08_08315 [Candidatus Obscuribacterales bacterium]